MLYLIFSTQVLLNVCSMLRFDKLKFFSSECCSYDYNDSLLHIFSCLQYTFVVCVSNSLSMNKYKYRTSATADARHQEVLQSANSISKYRVTRSYYVV